MRQDKVLFDVKVVHFFVSKLNLLRFSPSYITIRIHKLNFYNIV